MKASRPRSRSLPVEILPPEETPAAVPPVGTQPVSGWATFYHPASGAAILGIDLLAFGSEFVSGFLATPFACLLAFVITLPAVYLIQSRWSGERPLSAFAKAFLGAFLAGLPFSIAGGVFGAAVMALSGLPHPKTLLKKAVAEQVRRRFRQPPR